MFVEIKDISVYYNKSLAIKDVSVERARRRAW